MWGDSGIGYTGGGWVGLGRPGVEGGGGRRGCPWQAQYTAVTTRAVFNTPDGGPFTGGAAGEAGGGGGVNRPDDCSSSFGLVYWGLTPQQQPGSYQGGEMMTKSVIWWRKPEYPEETTELYCK